jgi:hypothetical protein
MSWNDFLDSDEFKGEHGHNRAVALLGEKVRESLVTLASEIDRLAKS